MSKSWVSVLPKVYELMIDNPEAIVDDTSIEKMILWLQEICHDKEEVEKLVDANTRTFEFLENENVFSNSTSLAFALRLLGILFSSEGVYLTRNSEESKTFVERILQKMTSKEFCMAWREAVVRDAWLKCMSSLLDSDYGLNLMKTLGHINKVLEALIDSSIFVSSSAEKCFAKYVLKANQQKFFGDVIASLDQLETLITSGHVKATLNVAFNIMNLDPLNGQEALTKRPLFHGIIQLLKTSDMSLCWKIVDLITELSKNTRKWNLDWTALLVRNGDVQPESSLAAGEMLLELPIVLIERGFLSCSLILVPGLLNAASNQCTGSFPKAWLDILCNLIDLPIKLLLEHFHSSSKDLILKEDLQTQNGKSIADSASIARGLFHGDHKAALAKVGDFIKQRTEQKDFAVDIVLHSLAAMQDITKQCFETEESSVFQHWVVLTLDVFENCLSTDVEQPPCTGWHGNHKILKVCLDTLARFAECRLFEGSIRHDSLSGNNLFLMAFKLVLQVIESSRTDDRVICCAFKTLASLVMSSDKSLIESLLGASRFEEPEIKRFKTSCQRPSSDEQTNLGKAELKEKLAFLIHRRLRDHQWEIRDSTLEFILSCVLQGYLQELIIEHSIHLPVWNAIDDGESFVRASALLLMGHLVCQRKLWNASQQMISLDDVVFAVCKVLRDDPDAFPRRRAMESLILWVKNMHSITDKLICWDDFAEEEKAEIQKEPIFNIIKESSSNKDLCDVVRVICKASQDFDWEVKVLALDFWEAFINYCIQRISTKTCGAKSNELFHGVTDSPSSFFDSKGDNSALTFKGVLASTNSNFVNECLYRLNAVGAVRVILDALEDCDLMVCERAVTLLIFLKKQMMEPNYQHTGRTINMIEELKNTLHEKGDRLTVLEFRQIILATDLEAVLDSLSPLDGKIRSDPTSFLEDILAAATNRQENLLDCY